MKKFIYKIIIIIFGYIFFIFPIKITRIYSSRVGTLCSQLDNLIYWKKKNKFTFCLISIDKYCPNKIIFNNLKNKLSFSILSPKIFYIHSIIKKNYFLNKRMVLDEKVLGPNVNYISASETNFNFTKSQIIKSKKLIEKTKITNNFIVLHNRDNLYLESLNKKLKDYNYHNYRNFEFNVYYKIIKKFNNLDFVRLGQIASPIIFKNKNFFDLTNRKYNELLTCYLIKNCKFAIIGLTGFSDIARLMRKPILAINFMPLSINQFFALPENTIILPKKIFCRKKNRFLTIQEQINLNDKNIHVNFDFYKKNNLYLLDNTKEEVFDAFEEMLNKIEPIKFKINDKLTILDREKIQNKINKIPYMRTLHNKLNINISYTFLKKNYDIL